MNKNARNQATRSSSSPSLRDPYKRDWHDDGKWLYVGSLLIVLWFVIVAAVVGIHDAACARGWIACATEQQGQQGSR